MENEKGGKYGPRVENEKPESLLLNRFHSPGSCKC